MITGPNIAIIVWFSFLAFILIKGSKKMKHRADQAEIPFRGKYQSLVANGMFISGIMLICMMLLALLSMKSNLK